MNWVVFTFGGFLPASSAQSHLPQRSDAWTVPSFYVQHGTKTASLKTWDDPRYDTVLSDSLTTSQMAKAAECSKRSVINISNNLRRFGNVRAPPTQVGRRRSVTPPMLHALCDHLLEKPGLYISQNFDDVYKVMTKPQYPQINNFSSFHINHTISLYNYWGNFCSFHYIKATVTSVIVFHLKEQKDSLSNPQHVKC